jgi:hypothetical protein
MAGCTAEASNPVLVTVNPLPAQPVITQSYDTLYASGSGNFQWYLDGTLIPGATANFYIPLVNGNYTVTVTDGNGCENISVIYPMTNVGIYEYYAAPVMIHPNPSEGAFQVTSNSTDRMDYVIADITGKILQTGALYFGRNSFDLTTLSDGVYLLQIITTDQPVSVVKLVKQ